MVVVELVLVSRLWLRLLLVRASRWLLILVKPAVKPCFPGCTVAQMLHWRRPGFPEHLLKREITINIVRLEWF